MRSWIRPVRSCSVNAARTTSGSARSASPGTSSPRRSATQSSSRIEAVGGLIANALGRQRGEVAQILELTDDHDAAVFDPGVSGKRRRMGGHTNAETKLAVKSAPPEHGGSRKRLEQARRTPWQPPCDCGD